MPTYIVNSFCYIIPFGAAAGFFVETLPEWSRVYVWPNALSLVLVVMETSATAHREASASPRNPYVVNVATKGVGRFLLLILYSFSLHYVYIH